jgi:hypothetical protein
VHVVCDCEVVFLLHVGLERECTFTNLHYNVSDIPDCPDMTGCKRNRSVLLRVCMKCCV